MVAAVDDLGMVDLNAVDITDRGPLLVRLKRAQSKLDAHIGRTTHAADAAGAFIGTGARDTEPRRHRAGRGNVEILDLTNAVTSGAISASPVRATA